MGWLIVAGLLILIPIIGMMWPSREERRMRRETGGSVTSSWLPTSIGFWGTGGSGYDGGWDGGCDSDGGGSDGGCD